MRTAWFQLALICVLSIQTGCQTAPPAKVYKDWKDLTDLLNQIKADSKVPAIGVGYRHGNQAQLAVTGIRELNKPDIAEIGDRWLIGSITKSMTATLIARLVDKGLLRWDTTLREALPKTPMRPEYEKVTILELLHHRSGVPQDQYVTPAFLDEAAGDSTDVVREREHYARFTLNRDPIGKPDEKMAYSNAGYSLLGHIAETVAKKPYERLMQDLVFKPLDMLSAKIGVPGTPGNPGGPGELQGHLRKGDDIEPHVLDEPKLTAIQAPAGLGVSMCLLDLLKFAEYHLHGMRGMVTLMKPEVFAVLHKPAQLDPGGYLYACGWVVGKGRQDVAVQGHNGSDGTFFAEIAIWPADNFAAVGVSNAGNSVYPSPPLQAVRAVHNREMAPKPQSK